MRRTGAPGLGRFIALGLLSVGLLVWFFVALDTPDAPMSQETTAAPPSSAPADPTPETPEERERRLLTEALSEAFGEEGPELLDAAPELVEAALLRRELITRFLPSGLSLYRRAVLAVFSREDIESALEGLPEETLKERVLSAEMSPWGDIILAGGTACLSLTLEPQEEDAFKLWLNQEATADIQRICDPAKVSRKRRQAIALLAHAQYAKPETILSVPVISEAIDHEGVKNTGDLRHFLKLGLFARRSKICPKEEGSATPPSKAPRLCAARWTKALALSRMHQEAMLVSDKAGESIVRWPWLANKSMQNAAWYLATAKQHVNDVPLKDVQASGDAKTKEMEGEAAVFLAHLVERVGDFNEALLDDEELFRHAKRLIEDTRWSHNIVAVMDLSRAQWRELVRHDLRLNEGGEQNGKVLARLAFREPDDDASRAQRLTEALWDAHQREDSLALLLTLAQLHGLKTTTEVIKAFNALAAPKTFESVALSALSPEAKASIDALLDPKRVTQNADALARQVDTALHRLQTLERHIKLLEGGRVTWHPIGFLLEKLVERQLRRFGVESAPLNEKIRRFLSKDKDERETLLLGLLPLVNNDALREDFDRAYKALRARADEEADKADKALFNEVMSWFPLFIRDRVESFLKEEYERLKASAPKDARMGLSQAIRNALDDLEGHNDALMAIRPELRGSAGKLISLLETVEGEAFKHLTYKIEDGSFETDHFSTIIDAVPVLGPIKKAWKKEHFEFSEVAADTVDVATLFIPVGAVGAVALKLTSGATKGLRGVQKVTMAARNLKTIRPGKMNKIKPLGLSFMKAFERLRKAKRRSGSALIAVLGVPWLRKLVIRSGALFIKPGIGIAKAAHRVKPVLDTGCVTLEGAEILNALVPLAEDEETSKSTRTEGLELAQGVLCLSSHPLPSTLTDKGVALGEKKILTRVINATLNSENLRVKKLSRGLAGTSLKHLVKLPGVEEATKQALGGFIKRLGTDALKDKAQERLLLSISLHPGARFAPLAGRDEGLKLEGAREEPP